MKTRTIFFLLILFFSACKKDPPTDPNDLTNIEYNPSSYSLSIPESFPILEIPEDNPLTYQGVQLGRRLFYDPIMSADSTMSCFSCHDINYGFNEPLSLSKGIDGIEGPRSSMSLLNVGFFYNGLFWDGRSHSLEQQALEPITNPLELHDTWENVIVKLKRHENYPTRFREAFGIEHKNEITKELVAKALAQFQRIIIAGGNSKYDRVLRGEEFFTDSEFNGYDMFFDLSPDMPDAECAHCHGGPLFTTNEYVNNGISNVNSLEDFIDKGRGEVTGVLFDNGKFKIPTLRNITLTPPYMHDGRFATIEEVIHHYNSGGHYADNLDPLILPLNLSEQNIQDIIAFLRTLEDTEYTTNPDLQNPFE